MTKEEKQLLFKDLCSRLPYGVMINYFNISQNSSIDAKVIGYSNGFIDIDNHSLNPEFVKPYLRPMSSMTDKEAAEFETLCDKLLMEADSTKIWNSVVDWLDEHAFDHRGLISMDLALEAPKDMYKM